MHSRCPWVSIQAPQSSGFAAMTNYLALTYGLTIPLVVGMAAYAMILGYFKRRINHNNELFITARKQAGPFLIGWSFYAAAVGAWVIASPASYAAYGGMLGLVMYSLASGLPFIMIAFAGAKIQSKMPGVLSFTDYIGWRFGLVSKTLAFAIVLFNMSIALLAEYVTIGSIFQSFVGSVPYSMILVTGILTTIYTSWGGLIVSLYTDQIQGAASVLLFVVLAIYLAVTFRPNLPEPMPCDPSPMPYVANVTEVPTYCISGTPNCGAFDAYNQGVAASLNASTSDPAALLKEVPCPITGWSSILTMPASLFTATIFSEAMWQRAWASRDTRTLHLGAIVGSIGVILVVFFAGFCGLLAAWGGLITSDTNGNLYLFQVLGGGQIPPQQTVYNWIGVFTVMLAAVMNEGAVDSMQNGMAAAITSFVTPFYKKWNLPHTRLMVALVNIILIIIAIWLTGCFGSSCGTSPVQIGVLQLFLMANILACCGAFPVLFGLSDRLHPYFGGVSFVFSTLFPILCVCIYGANYYFSNFPVLNGLLILSDPTNSAPYIVQDYNGHTYNGASLSDALFYTWIGNNYGWQFFLVPMGVSLGSILLCVGINAVLMHVFKFHAKPLPGFAADATHPELLGTSKVDLSPESGIIKSSSSSDEGGSDGKLKEGAEGNNLTLPGIHGPMVV